MELQTSQRILSRKLTHTHAVSGNQFSRPPQTNGVKFSGLSGDVGTDPWDSFDSLDKKIRDRLKQEVKKLETSSGLQISNIVYQLQLGSPNSADDKQQKEEKDDPQADMRAYLEKINNPHHYLRGGENNQLYEKALAAIPNIRVRNSFDASLDGLFELYKAMNKFNVYNGKLIFGVMAQRRMVKATNAFTKSLGKINDDKLLSQWIDTLLSNTYVDVRYAAAYNIHRVLDPATRDRLIEKACKDEDADVRIEGLNRLVGHSNPKKQQELLLALSQDKKDHIRARAGMLTGERPMAKFLWGWMVFKGKSAEASRIMLEKMEQRKANMSESLTKDDRTRSLVNEIKSLADDMENDLLKLASATPDIKDALIRKYGSEKHFPNADDFKNLFYRSAKKYYKNQQPWLSRWTFQKVDEPPVLEFTRFLLEIAKEGGYYFLEEKELNTENLGMVKKLQEHRSKLETDMTQAKMMVVKTVISQQQAQTAYDQKKAEVSQAEAQFKEAAKKQEEDQQNYLRLHRQLQTEQQLLKKAEERKTAADAFAETAQAKLEGLENQARLHQANLSNAIQVGLLNASKEELNRLVEQSEMTLKDATVHRTMDQVDQQRFEAQADLETTRREKQLAEAGKAALELYGTPKEEPVRKPLFEDETYPLEDEKPQQAQVRKANR